MQHWWVDPSFDPLQELKDLKKEHEELARCHNELVTLVKELSEQHTILLAHIKSLKYTERLPRPVAKPIS